MLKSTRINHLEYSLLMKYFPPDYSWEAILAASIDYTTTHRAHLAVKTRHNQWIEEQPELRLRTKNLKWEYKGFQIKQWTITDLYYDKLMELKQYLHILTDVEVISVCIQNYAKYLNETQDDELLKWYVAHRKELTNKPEMFQLKVSFTQEVYSLILQDSNKRHISHRDWIRHVVREYYGL